MTRHLLYSTNVYLKLLLQERYWGDVHYIWCSEYFDCSDQSKYSSSSMVAPSSNPSSIYRELKRDVEGKDTHSAKITAQKASFTERAIQSAANGEICEDERDDILYMVERSPFEYWRPLLYVIPADPVLSRLKLVPIKNRAGFGNEYIIEDLKRTEFDIVEF